VLSKDGQWADKPYHKTHLLAFGEYVPFGEMFPKFYEWLPYTGHFGRGPGPTALDADGIKIGAQICYEGLFDRFTRGLAIKGAQVIVNVTNDSWYGTWEEPYQHLYMTLARAVEVRRPLIRSTNTGISTVIEANGKIHALSPLQQEWFHLYEVPYYSAGPETWFAGFGFWFFPVLMLLGFGFAILRGRQA
jgi:apolipoprotein N-acyltransferase